MCFTTVVNLKLLYEKNVDSRTPDRSRPFPAHLVNYPKLSSNYKNRKPFPLKTYGNLK